MRKSRELWVLLILLFFLSLESYSQTFWTLDFEGTGGYTTSVAEYTNDAYVYWGRINSSGDEDLYNVNGNKLGDIDGITNITNIQGTYYFGGNNVDDIAVLPLSLDIDDVDITGKTNLVFKIYVADDNPGNWESSDYVHIKYDIDNTGTFTDLLLFESDGSKNAAIDTDTDGEGDGTVVTSSFNQIVVVLPGTGSTLDIKIEFSLDSNDDQFYIDDLELGEVKGEPSNHASSFSTLIKGYDKIDLSWTDASSGTLPDGYLISASTANSFSDPVDGTDPSEDTDLSDGSGLVKVLQGVESYTFTSLNPSTQYYFKMWAYNNSNSDIDFKTDGTPPTANETTSMHFVINEFLADPAGDANGDGTTNTTEDEFIEFVNNTGSSQNIGNWTIEDAGGTTYTFPDPTNVNDGESVVVFSGGTPSGISGVVLVKGTSLSLNNGGDEVVLKNSSGVVIDSVSYGSEGDDAQSLARDPNITGDFVKHTTITTNSVAFSPGENNTTASQLPVELASFSATPTNNSVKLTWQTATEVNNYGFNVEWRMENGEPGLSGDEGWETKGFVQGYGTTNSPKSYSFVDQDLPNADKVSYRLKQIDNDGIYSYSKVVEVELSKVTGVDEGIEYTFSLNQNYPNPFNPTTTISFTLPDVGSQNHAKLNVYNLLGQKVRTLVNESKPAGQYEVQFDASSLPSGIYFYTLSYGKFTQTRKLMLMK